MERGNDPSRMDKRINNNNNTMKITKAKKVSKYKRLVVNKVEILNSNSTEYERERAVMNINKAAGSNRVSLDSFKYSVDFLLEEDRFLELSKIVQEHAVENGLDPDTMKPFGVINKGAPKMVDGKYVVRAASAITMPPTVELVEADGTRLLYDSYIRKGSIVTLDISLGASTQSVLSGQYEGTVPVYFSGMLILKNNKTAKSQYGDYDPLEDMKDLDVPVYSGDDDDDGGEADDVSF